MDVHSATKTELGVQSGGRTLLIWRSRSTRGTHTDSSAGDVTLPSAQPYSDKAVHIKHQTHTHVYDSKHTSTHLSIWEDTTGKSGEVAWHSLHSDWSRAGWSAYQGSSPQIGQTIFTITPLPDRLWDPSGFLFNGYRQIISRRYSRRSAKVITHLQVVPMSRKRGCTHPLRTQ
jgi:hypothetical protein